MAKLPELPDNNTDRIYIEYTCLGQRHSAELRQPAGAGAPSAETVYANYAPLIAAFLQPTDSVTGARFSAAGTNVSFPLSVTAVAGTSPSASTPDNKPNFISWTGRSSAGRRVRFTIFTAVVGEPERYRLQPPLAGAAAAVRNKLVSGAPAIVTKDNSPAIWNSYANTGVNSYYQRKQRRVG